MKLLSLDGSITDARDDQEVFILPCTEPPPPIDTTDFPEEFVSSVTHSFRPSYFGSTYQMTLSMPEPTPMSGILYSTTTLRLHVRVQLTTCKRNDGLRTLCNILKDLRFHMRLALRTKTFHSITPFSQMPGYTMIGTDYPLDLHESVMKIQAVELASSSWQPHFYSETSQPEALQHGVPASPRGNCSQPPKANAVNGLSFVQADGTMPPIDGWTTALDVPMHIKESLTPSFCSAIASRQYSLIARVKVEGGPWKDFPLEVPLQIYCSPRSEASSPAHESRSASGSQAQSGKRPGTGDHQLSGLWNDVAVRIRFRYASMRCQSTDGNFLGAQARGRAARILLAGV